MLAGYLGCRYLTKNIALPTVLIIGILLGVVASCAGLPVLYPIYIAPSSSAGIGIYVWFGVYLFYPDLELFTIAADLNGFSPLLIVSFLILSALGVMLGFELAKRRVTETSIWPSE